MADETQTTNTAAEGQQPNADPAATGDSTGKTFTQEEVNRIVSDRLARERSKAEAPVNDREQELNAREASLKCRELVAGSDGKYPAKLADILDTSDFDRFKETADKLIAAFPMMGHVVERKIVGTGFHGSTGGRSDMFAQLFKPKG